MSKFSSFAEYPPRNPSRPPLPYEGEEFSKTDGTNPGRSARFGYANWDRARAYALG